MNALFLWGGLTLIVAGPVLGIGSIATFLGAICMVIGWILLLLGK